ncbi:MAG: hypothetical protein AAGF60_07850 [Pseudomonadota bacterium]
MSVTQHNGTPAAAPSPPVRACIAQTQRALRICDLLEALADDLPKRSVPFWDEAQTQCQSVLRPHFSWLHDIVLPALLQKPEGGVDRLRVLSRLSSDCGDQLHALGDLDDLIADASGSARLSAAPDALGYALRGHFDSLRRDLTWQTDVLWPLAARMCSAPDLHGFVCALGRPQILH